MGVENTGVIWIDEEYKRNVGRGTGMKVIKKGKRG
jgi:hypothetical protein